MSKKILVIGGSAAGPKAASKARRLDQNAEITIIQKSKYLSMASCGYPYFVGGVFDDPNKLISSPTGTLRDPSFFSKIKDINAFVSTEAYEIDREKKTVKTRNIETGEEKDFPYDKLILTTGAKPIKPPIPGIDLRGITTLQSMEDAVYLKEAAKNQEIKCAAVVGGGLIGIETAEALQLAGINVTIVEKMNQILGFLDWEMAKHVENHIKSKGNRVLTNTAVEEFLGKDGVLTGIKLSNGDEIKCDLAVVSIGNRPNVELAEKSGLTIGETGGIKVNRFLQTNDPDIYAAGDCIEITNLITHDKVLWPMGDAANLQGRVAGQNVVLGNVEEYEGAVMTGICKAFDYGAGSSGMTEKEAERQGYFDVITVIHAGPDKPFFMGAKLVIQKLIADRRTCRLLGIQAVGPGDISKRLAIGAMALHSGMRVSDLVNLDLPYAPPFSQAIENFITASHILENKCLNRFDGISAVEFKKKLDRKDDMFIIDVRTPQEFEEVSLGIGEKNIPLGAVRSKTDLLPKDKDKEIILYCKISLRGYEASCFIKSLGYTNVKILEGGVAAWPYK